MDLDATTECNTLHSVHFEAEISLSEASEISLQQIPGKWGSSPQSEIFLQVSYMATDWSLQQTQICPLQSRRRLTQEGVAVNGVSLQRVAESKQRVPCRQHHMDVRVQPGCDRSQSTALLSAPNVSLWKQSDPCFQRLNASVWTLNLQWSDCEVPFKKNYSN